MIEDTATLIIMIAVAIFIGVIAFMFRGEIIRLVSKTPNIELNENHRKHGKSILKVVTLVLIAVIVVSVVGISSVKIVNAGYRGVLTHFNAVDETASIQEGIHFVVPFRDDIVPMEIRTQKAIENATSASKDLQNVDTTVAVNFHVNQDRVQYVYEQIGLDYYNRIITPAVQESVKQVTAKYNAEELITERALVKDEIDSAIISRMSNYNLIVDTISITDFQFSPDFANAIESKVVAQQNALKALNDLQRIKVEANQTIAIAKGQSSAIEIINSQLKSSPQYLQYLAIQKWNGIMPNVVGSNGLPLINIPIGNRTN